MYRYICFFQDKLWSLNEFFSPSNSEDILSLEKSDNLFQDKTKIKLSSKNYYLLDLTPYFINAPSKGFLINIRDFIMSSESHNKLIQTVSEAQGVREWILTNKYCGRCGSLTSFDYTERAAACSHCGNMVYPRVSPCVIMLIYNNKNEILLAKNVRFRKNDIYSTLAGFIDPGETLEQAVYRETFEEVGVYVKNLTYQQSQNWPFPQQLMVGFTAEYKSGIINLQEEEIEDAQWFHISKLPNIPGPGTIAGKLIRNFVSTRKND